MSRSPTHSSYSFNVGVEVKEINEWPATLYILCTPSPNSLLCPLSYLGVTCSLVLIFCFYLYHWPTFPFILDSLQQLPLFWYLAVIDPMHQHLLTLCLPSYFVYVSHVTYSHLWTFHNDSSPLLAVHVSQFLSYLHILFCYLLSMILCISQPIAKALTYSLTVQWHICSHTHI